MSQSELSRRSQVSRYTISRLENGERPTLRTARAVARGLGVTDLDSLFPQAPDNDESHAANVAPGTSAVAETGDDHANEV